jgi:hypothetical protein
MWPDVGYIGMGGTSFKTASRLFLRVEAKSDGAPKSLIFIKVTAAPLP